MKNIKPSKNESYLSKFSTLEKIMAFILGVFVAIFPAYSWHLSNSKEMLESKSELVQLANQTRYQLILDLVKYKQTIEFLTELSEPINLVNQSGETLTLDDIGALIPNNTGLSSEYHALAKEVTTIKADSKESAKAFNNMATDYIEFILSLNLIIDKYSEFENHETLEEFYKDKAMVQNIIAFTSIFHKKMTKLAKTLSENKSMNGLNKSFSGFAKSLESVIIEEP